MWVLIVFFAVGTGGYANGEAVNFQEFETDVSCKQALVLIQEKTDKVEGKKFRTVSGEEWHRIRGYCVKK